MCLFVCLFHERSLMETIDTVHDGLRTFLSEQAPLVQQAKCIEARVEAAEGRGEGGGEEGIATNLRRPFSSPPLFLRPRA